MRLRRAVTPDPARRVQRAGEFQMGISDIVESIQLTYLSDVLRCSLIYNKHPSIKKMSQRSRIFLKFEQIFGADNVWLSQLAYAHLNHIVNDLELSNFTHAVIVSAPRRG